MVYNLFLVVHILATIIAVGSATLTDYLHLISLRRKSLEKKLVDIFPYFTRMINFALITIYISGIVLVTQKPELLSSSLFITKMALVFIVTVNGIYLQRKVAPHLDICVMKGTKYCTQNVLYTSAISGSVSIVTWYATVILALTKNYGYTLGQFITAYVIILGVAVFTAYHVEKRARKWRK